MEPSASEASISTIFSEGHESWKPFAARCTSFYNLIRRDIEAVITRRSWKPFGWKPTWVRIPLSPPEKSTHLSTKTMCAFFNEIRLRRVKYGSAMWNSSAVKYLLRKCEKANFISHRTKWDISQFTRWIISHSATPNISLEKHRNLLQMIYKATSWFICESVL